jgi:hypothetical protein
VARAGADVLQQNAETLQSALRFGLDTATSAMGPPTSSVARSGCRATKRNAQLKSRPATLLRSFNLPRHLPKE